MLFLTNKLNRTAAQEDSFVSEKTLMSIKDREDNRTGYPLSVFK